VFPLVAPVDAEADDLLAGQGVNVLELHGACGAEQSDIDAHPDNIARNHAVGALVPAFSRGGAHLPGRRSEAAEMHHHFRRMDRQHRIGGNLARGRAQHQIGARRVARRTAGPEFAVQFAAGLLQLEADVLSCASKPHSLTTVRATRAVTGFSRSMAPIASAWSRLPAGRGEIDRQVAASDFLEEIPEARRRG
jgi:hypothetical protein